VFDVRCALELRVALQGRIDIRARAAVIEFSSPWKLLLWICFPKESAVSAPSRELPFWTTPLPSIEWAASGR